MKILIADDEAIDRQGIRFMIKRMGLQAEIFEALNGIEALDIVNHEEIDLIVTDIKMPGLTGVELIAKIINERPDIKCIVVSAFGEFEYAKKLMRMGVSHYIIKPINPQEFAEALKEAVYEIENNKNDDWRNRIHRLLNNEKNDLSNWPFGNNVMLLYFSNPLYNKTKEELHAYLGIEMKPFFTVFINEYQILLFSDLSYTESLDVSKKIITFFQKTHSKEKITVVHGGVLVKIEDLYQVYQKLETLCENQFYTDSNAVYSVYDMPTQSAFEDDYFKRISAISRMVLDKKTEALSEFHQLFEDINKTGGMSSVFVKYLCSEFVKNILGTDIGGHDQMFSEYLKKIYDCDSLNGVLKICEELIDQSICTDKEGEDYNKRAVSMVIEYIKANYKNEISLEQVAQYVFLSPSYLCQIFKKETGESFIKYLTAYRLEQARRLLVTTGLKVNDVCDVVGYHDVSYFCSLFKSYFGATPSQYRRKH